MTLYRDGKLGIGTTTPSVALDVVGACNCTSTIQSGGIFKIVNTGAGSGLQTKQITGDVSGYLNLIHTGTGGSITAFNSIANSAGTNVTINNYFANGHYFYLGDDATNIANFTSAGLMVGVSGVSCTMGASGNLIRQYAAGTAGAGINLGGSAVVPINYLGNSANGTIALGGPNPYLWSQLYAATATINTSDITMKQDIVSLSEAEKRVATRLLAQTKRYRWKEAVANKGDAARFHIGWMSQHVQGAFEAEGLDASNYGMWTRDESWLVNGQGIDANGVPYTSESENAVLTISYGLRYEEVQSFLIGQLANMVLDLS